MPLLFRNRILTLIHLMATATKTSLENKNLGSDEYFMIIASSWNPLLLTEHTENGLLEPPLR